MRKTTPQARKAAGGIPPSLAKPPAGQTELRIVGIGASAGGLPAIEAFFDAFVPDLGTPLAFIVVQHLDPEHKSLLIELVQRHARIPILQVEDGMAARGNCAYVIPPNKELVIRNGTLHLSDFGAPRSQRLPIDRFFRSLAEDQRERAIGIVLSGTGSDGTLGLQAIKGEGGMVMVQRPESAAFDGMPRSAIAGGEVDYILRPEKMPEQLLDYARYAAGRKPAQPLQPVLTILRAQTHHDFSHYKAHTVQRRVARRMAIAKIERLDEYACLLEKDPREVEQLFHDLLIGVTSFFRDPAAFEALQNRFLPHLLTSVPAGERVRVWVPACSTGEEAFSLAILFQELADAHRVTPEVQIFATDIDDDAIRKARSGVYLENIAADVSPERLSRFFSRDGGTYRVHKGIRDLVVFAQQDVITDPPFTKLDLVSCRNLLIYLDAELQRRLGRLFHYALRADGYLFLGSSETMGQDDDLFTAIDRKAKIYQRSGGARPPAIARLPQGRERDRVGPPPGKTAETRSGELRQAAERALLEDHTPACVIVDADLEIRYIHGRTGPYLEPAQGDATLNLLRMVREGLKLSLISAVHQANAQHTTVRAKGVRVRMDGSDRFVALVVQPLVAPNVAPGLLMILFEDVTASMAPPATHDAPSATHGRDQRIVELEQELATRDESLRRILEETGTTNDELRSANEELQSLNEELQSANEELETSREELQSINEELVTVNAELRNKMEELSQASNDMNNLLVGTGIATLFLDPDLHVKRFTPAATQIIKLLPADVGRPVGDIVSRLSRYDHLEQDAQEVLDTLVPKESEVETRDGRWYLMRIHPYRTLDNVIEGVVLTFSEISRQKELQAQLQVLSERAAAARDYAESVVDTIREPLLVLNGAIEIISANRSFYEFFNASPQETIGRHLYDLGRGEWDVPELRRLLEEVLPKDTRIDGFEIAIAPTDTARRVLRLNARELQPRPGRERLILVAIEEVTAH